MGKLENNVWMQIASWIFGVGLIAFGIYLFREHTSGGRMFQAAACIIWGLAAAINMSIRLYDKIKWFVSR